MLTLVTGTPGAGKTLWTINEVEKLRQESGRPVFYWGIPDLKYEWFELDSAENWYKAPDGAIIVLDECWEYFPPRKAGSAVPEHVEPMATHRHRGHDVYTITQHSTQVDTFIRKMVSNHHHVIRRFGSSVATVYTWGELANERDYHDRQRAATSVFKYPKEHFGAYRSTVLDTAKSKLPWFRIAALIGGLFLVPLLIWGGVAAVWPEEDDSSGSPPSPGTVSPAPVPGGRYVNNPYHPENWLPRVSDIPYSAAFYDELITPQAFPKIRGCMRMTFSDGKDRCTCNDQQGNNIRVSYETCVDIVKNGVFDFTRPDELEDPEPAPVEDQPSYQSPSPGPQGEGAPRPPAAG
jgi:zona occludens toxin